MAADRSTIKVTGARELRAAMLNAGLSLKDLSAVNRKVSTLVAQRAKLIVPRRSGRLAGNIRPGATRTQAVVRAGNSGSVPYAGVIHYGWAKRNIRPNPFITRAALQTETRWTDTYQNEIDRLLAMIDRSTNGA